FITRETNATGSTLTEYCINTDIYFENGTTGTGIYTYLWEFFDGPLDTDPSLGTSTDVNPTFQYATGGQKLVRLIATDNNADGSCEEVFEDIVDIALNAVADFDFYDEFFTSTINPVFCQTGSETFTVGFRDNTIDVANTEYRYEFYDEADNLISTEPTSGGFLTDPVPDFTRSFTNEEFIRVRLVAFNTSTSCSSFAQDTIFIYDQPLAFFEADTVCEGELTTFASISPSNDIPIIVNNDFIDVYEWDFSYDAVAGFNPEPPLANNTNFTRLMNDGDIVALRTTSNKGGCPSEIYVDTVSVHHNPVSTLFATLPSEICPGDLIQFTNTAIVANSAITGLTVDYFLDINQGGTPRPTITFNTPDTLLEFNNVTTGTLQYDVTLRAVSGDGCTINSAPPILVDILPEAVSDFDDPVYDLFSSNCSPWSSEFEVDAATLALGPDAITWYLSENGAFIPEYPAPIVKNSVDPDFDILAYDITNTSNAIRNIEVVMEVSSSTICIANDTFNIQISPQPSAEFTINKIGDCDDVVFELEAVQKGLTNYGWSYVPAPTNEFGSDDQRLVSYTRDVNSGSDFNVTISLTTTNLAGCVSTTADSVKVVEKRRPDLTAEFTTSSNIVQLPDATVNLTNTSTPDNGFTYEWDFGGQGTSTDRDPGSFTFTNFGTFEIELTITDEFCEDSFQQTINVLPADPVIDFEGDTLRGCAPLTVKFTNLSQSAIQGEFLWEFGDGSISNLDEPEHTYFDGGSYNVRLVGENNVGTVQDTTKVAYIEVLDKPFANFVSSQRVVTIPDEEVFFRDLGSGVDSYFWDFGDGFTSTSPEPSHSYTLAGFYDVTLIVFNELGCSDTLARVEEIEAVEGGETDSPNAFTPDLSGPSGGADDGRLDVNSVNDVFLPKAEGIVNFKMFIYNKWGQLLFESSDKNVGWDGYYQGKLAPAGVYVYKLELKYSDGRDEIQAGDVTLIR
ncbi:MAG: PKD domain-containing protein, partial [Bacteroidota bacterium]